MATKKKYLASSSDSDESRYDDARQSMVFLLTQKYQTFKIRSSYLDTYTQGSPLTKSLFLGFYNLSVIFGIIMIVAYPIQRYSRTGQLINSDLVDTFKRDFFIVIACWPLLYLYAHTAFLLIKLVQWGVSLTIVKILQHCTQLLIFLCAMYLVFSRGWCLTHTAFITIQCCVMLMKMHSYTVTNLDYRQEYLESLNDNQKKPFSPYPRNVNLSNFTLYMWMPTLVYEYEYPRSERVRPLVVLKIAVKTVGCILASYILITDFVMPYIQQGDKISAVVLLARMLLPICIFMVLIFYTIWECILNFFAEITRFGDRQFYQDWWNSTTYEEFNRKWNRPVHIFFFRHCYLDLIHRWRKSRKVAQAITFFVSAILHEWVLALLFRVVRPIMFLFMLQQIPLFIFTRNMHGTRSGNILFWWGLVFGVPLIGMLYLRSDPYVTKLFSKDS